MSGHVFISWSNTSNSACCFGDALRCVAFSCSKHGASQSALGYSVVEKSPVSLLFRAVLAKERFSLCKTTLKSTETAFFWQKTNIMPPMHPCFKKLVEIMQFLHFLGQILKNSKFWNFEISKCNYGPWFSFCHHKLRSSRSESNRRLRATCTKKAAHTWHADAIWKLLLFWPTVARRRRLESDLDERSLIDLILPPNLKSYP